MEDSGIIALYFARDEAAIRETGKKYGGFCGRIALNILSRREDAEECVNDTYLTVWNKVPPTQPNPFKGFLGKIVRDLAISRYRREHAAKRFHGMDVMLSELEECIPAAGGIDAVMDEHYLTGCIEAFLDTLEQEERVMFVRRYWYGESVAQLARERGFTANQTSQRLFRLRKTLREHLEKEGIEV